MDTLDDVLLDVIEKMDNTGKVLRDQFSGLRTGKASPALVDGVKARVQALRDADPGNTAPVPVDLVTASASGLDPHISVAAARYQVKRVATARKLDTAMVAGLVEQFTERPLLRLLGEPGVNVLRLNLALQEIQP